jgi:hypothetical protein
MDEFSAAKKASKEERKKFQTSGKAESEKHRANRNKEDKS